MYQSKVKLSLTFTQRLGYLIKLVTVKWSNEHSEANEGKHYLNGLNQYVLTIKRTVLYTNLWPPQALTPI